MIKTLQLANIGAYDSEGAKLTGLNKLNFIFGSNGSGKTTISRLIGNSISKPGCHVNWEGGTPVETRVYNRDFVERNFDSERSIKGVYTFGDNNKVIQYIVDLRKSEENLKDKLKSLTATLNGDDSARGKITQRDELKRKFIEDVWTAKSVFGDLDQAFRGLNNSKAKFCAEYEKQAIRNTASLREHDDLRRDASIVYSASLVETERLPEPDCSSFSMLESSRILCKVVVGKKDVDISALILKLGNSDWVQQGRRYYDFLDNQCPFCQQDTDASFRLSLEEFFDTTYLQDLAEIDNLYSSYEAAFAKIMEEFTSPEIVNSPYLDREGFDRAMNAFRLALEANALAIKQKRSEPSSVIELRSTLPLACETLSYIRAANSKVDFENDILENLESRKRTLSAEIWKRLLKDTESLSTAFMRDAAGLDAAITSINEQIVKRSDELAAKRAEISECERKITSIRPTIDAINSLLKSFGFSSFFLVESETSGFYEVKRHNGDYAKATLSEGEKSFITFLYFYHLIDGSFSSSGAATAKVVVFDDPVSSLDSDILFIVCSLIKVIIAAMRAGSSDVKQIFVLTHNVYFHKEVTFHKDRRKEKALADETFWVIRKLPDRSILASFQENPVKSSYELLWREVRNQPPSETAIQNAMRRIIENYFKFFGGLDPQTLIERFSGADRMIAGSLFSWMNDGSHFVNDDLFTSCDPGQIGRYLRVFQKIFDETGHLGHYRMMMGDDYVALDAASANDDSPPVGIAPPPKPLTPP